MINYETSKSVKVLLKLYYSQRDTLATVVEVAKPSLKNKITSNIKGLFSFLNRGFHAFVFSTLYILSILDYHHVHFQRFRHFSIIVTIFNREFWSVTSRNSPGIPVCLDSPEDDQLLLMRSRWCSNFFIPWMPKIEPNTEIQKFGFRVVFQTDPNLNNILRKNKIYLNGTNFRGFRTKS